MTLGIFEISTIKSCMHIYAKFCRNAIINSWSDHFELQNGTKNGHRICDAHLVPTWKRAILKYPWMPVTVIKKDLELKTFLTMKNWFFEMDTVVPTLKFKMPYLGISRWYQNDNKNWEFWKNMSNCNCPLKLQMNKQLAVSFSKT